MSSNPQVGIIMGSDSDLAVMKEAGNILEELGVAAEYSIISAHRTPDRMVSYARQAQERGLKAIIAGAGGAAHLPGMTASMTTLPVIGVPIQSRNSMDGWDSVLSILQMPSGIPVATVALDGAKNAGLLAARIVGAYDAQVAENLTQYQSSLANKVEKANERLGTSGSGSSSA